LVRDAQGSEGEGCAEDAERRSPEPKCMGEKLKEGAESEDSAHVEIAEEEVIGRTG